MNDEKGCDTDLHLNSYMMAPKHNLTTAIKVRRLDMAAKVLNYLKWHRWTVNILSDEKGLIVDTFVNSCNDLYIAHPLSEVPNRELSEAKSELPGGTVGVCSFHRRCRQLPYNLPITHIWFTPQSLQVCLLTHFNKWSIYE